MPKNINSTRAHRHAPYTPPARAPLHKQTNGADIAADLAQFAAYKVRAARQVAQCADSRNLPQGFNGLSIQRSDNTVLNFTDPAVSRDTPFEAQACYFAQNDTEAFYSYRCESGATTIDSVPSADGVLLNNGAPVFTLHPQGANVSKTDCGCQGVVPGSVLVNQADFEAACSHFYNQHQVEPSPSTAYSPSATPTMFNSASTSFSSIATSDAPSPSPTPSINTTLATVGAVVLGPGAIAGIVVHCCFFFHIVFYFSGKINFHKPQPRLFAKPENVISFQQSLTFRRWLCHSENRIS